MRILYLHQYFNLPTNSGGSRSYEMARRLTDAGHEVFMITSDYNGKFQGRWKVNCESGIEVHCLPVPYSNKMSYRLRIQTFVKFAWEAARRASVIPADIVFATSTPLTIALPGVYTARLQHIPMVFEVRDLWPEVPIAIGALKGPMVPPAKWLERFAYRHSEYIVALSTGMKNGILRTGYPEDRICVIPNSADLDLFHVPKSIGIEFKHRLNWLKDRPLVVYTGTLGRINGVEYLAKLADKVQQISPEIRFLVVGDGAEKVKMVNLARQSDVLGKNFFVMDPVPKKEMPTILSAADIAISIFVDLPEMRANSANKFFDALASGTPVAINYRGWQSELLKITKAGLVLHPTDIDMAAKHLVDFLHDKERMSRAARCARNLAEEKFDRNKLAKVLEEVLVRAVDDFVRKQK